MILPMTRESVKATKRTSPNMSQGWQSVIKSFGYLPAENGKRRCKIGGSDFMSRCVGSGSSLSLVVNDLYRLMV